jgi:hypothetical protein
MVSEVRLASWEIITMSINGFQDSSKKETSKRDLYFPMLNTLADQIILNDGYQVPTQ